MIKLKKNPISSFIRIIILSILSILYSTFIVLGLAAGVMALYFYICALFELFSTTFGHILVVAIVCLTLLFLYIFYKTSTLSSDHNSR